MYLLAQFKTRGFGFSDNKQICAHFLLRFNYIIVAILLVIVSFSSPSHAQIGDGDRAGRIRAALIYYIAKFVSIPKKSSERLVICSIGSDPLNAFLEDTVRGKNAQDRQIEAKLFSDQFSNEDLKSCDITFVGFLPEEKSKSVLSSINRAGHLTVCAVKELSWESCMIQIFESENRARLGVNPQILEAHGLRASSELLEVAVVKK